jgi:hypothetical protein
MHWLHNLYLGSLIFAQRHVRIKYCPNHGEEHLPANRLQVEEIEEGEDIEMTETLCGDCLYYVSFINFDSPSCLKAVIV